MVTRSKKRPSPIQLLAEVQGVKPAKTYEFDDYLEVVHELKGKDYSYADIAKFLADKLGISVTRGQVYRAHGLWLEVRHEAEKQAEEEAYLRSLDAENDVVVDTDTEELAQRLQNEAAVDLLSYIRKKYPEGSLPVDEAGLLKRALAFVDSETRDEQGAAEEDRRLAERKGGARGNK